LAAVSVGKADSSLLAGAPVQPGSLDDLLGRRPGSQAPWTRSIRLSLLALLPMAGAAGFARRRAMQNPRGDDQA
jgi:hypothetical protein